MKKALVHISLHSAVFIILLIALSVIGYIDLSVITSLYLPILILFAMLIFFRKHFIGHLFLLSAEIGLLTEYIIHLINVDNPNMRGSTVNIAILVFGLSAGVVIQLHADRKSSNR